MTKLLCVLVAAFLAQSASAGYILEIDTDGQDDGVLTYNPGFAFGGDTTIASQSVTAPVFGATGGDSIFGGDGNQFPDTYVYRYAPDSQPDNLNIPAGQALGEGNIGTGLAGGGPGLYRVYAAWPWTDNVSGGLTAYDVTTAGDSFGVQIDQNGGAAGRGSVWVLLGDINYTSGDITVTQMPTGANTFVSMRAYGLLFEVVPEPSSLGLLAAGSVVMLRRRR